MTITQKILKRDGKNTARLKLDIGLADDCVEKPSDASLLHLSCIAKTVLSHILSRCSRAIIQRACARASFLEMAYLFLEQSRNNWPGLDLRRPNLIFMLVCHGILSRSTAVSCLFAF